MPEFGNIPSFDEEGYHLAIIEKRNGKFAVYADLDGLRYFQREIIDATKYRGGLDHGDIYTNGDRHFKVGASKLTFLRLFIDYPPRVSPPQKPPLAYRMPTKVLEMAITLADAERLFAELSRMADKISNGREAGRIELNYGVSIEYRADWCE